MWRFCRGNPTATLGVAVAAASCPAAAAYSRSTCDAALAPTQQQQPQQQGANDNNNSITTREPLEKARSVSLETAQKWNVHRFRNKWTTEQIQEIFDFEEKHQKSLGTARRDGYGIRRMDGSWSTSYLHTDGLFRKEKGDLLQNVIDAAIEADTVENWNLLTGLDDNLNVRVVECHTVGKGGALQNIHHCDRGSLVTIDVMCSDTTKEFTGGRFMTLEEGGTLTPHEFQRGDMMVFPSHKYHCVEPVTSGTRRVFVVELWEGPEKICAHRCEDASEDCQYTVALNKLELMVTSSFPEIDPW